MKTREEVDALKKSWLKDGCFDIEDTEGFEEYRDELKLFSEEVRKINEADNKVRAARLHASKDIGGMTLREHYAGLAMQGYICGTEIIDPKDAATRAVQYADALLAELRK